jgi:hypothetical protein
VVQEYENKGDVILAQVGSLWELFEAIAMTSGQSNTICILDGLDECELELRRLLSALVHFCEPVITTKAPPGNRPLLKVIVTSRLENIIKTKFNRLPTIRLRGEDETEATEHDINLVVKYSLGEMATKDYLRKIPAIFGATASFPSRPDLLLGCSDTLSRRMLQGTVPLSMN